MPSMISRLRRIASTAPESMTTSARSLATAMTSSGVIPAGLIWTVVISGLLVYDGAAPYDGCDERRARPVGQVRV